jgi:hypothetical protein
MTMRTLAAAAAILLASVSTALAAPASVTVDVGPELRAKAENVLGVRDVDELGVRLAKTVQRQLANTPAYDGARIELVLVDAQPNHPTFKQLGDTPGLSYQSVGLGGAAIEGRVVAANGTVKPIAYKYYETSLRYSHIAGTWADADNTFQQFAGRLRRGQLVADR